MNLNCDKILNELKGWIELFSNELEVSNLFLLTSINATILLDRLSTNPNWLDVRNDQNNYYLTITFKINFTILIV